MKLGPKSRYLLELLAAFGGDALEGMFTISQFRRSILCSSDDNFRRRAQALRDRGLVLFDDTEKSGKWVASLTEIGNSLLAEDIDPVREWNTPWDGQWRLFAFDLPKSKSQERQALRRWMKRMRLGKLQGSLWITPKDLGDWIEELAKNEIDPSAVILFKGDFSGPISKQDYVEKAWDFDLINQRYSQYLDFLSKKNSRTLSADSFPDWFHDEIELWRSAFELDPFLPRVLWPNNPDRNYLGPQALAARQDCYNIWRGRLCSKSQP